jgi:thiol-disulfide isomerase/thioredoxin
VVNFWATWCEPCRAEVPALVRLRTEYASNGLEVVGIAVDSAAKVRDFAAEYRISYPLVIGGFETVDLSRRLGNKLGALPFTVVLDRSGRLVYTHLGAVSETELRDLVRPLLLKTQRSAAIGWTAGGKSAENPRHAGLPQFPP